MSFVRDKKYEMNFDFIDSFEPPTTRRGPINQ